MIPLSLARTRYGPTTGTRLLCEYLIAIYKLVGLRSGKWNAFAPEQVRMGTKVEKLVGARRARFGSPMFGK
jgi:hypothetical protein